MPEQPEPPPLHRRRTPPPAMAEPSHSAWYWFDGLVEGPLKDPLEIQQAAHRLEAVGITRVHLEIEGGRFSLLMDDTAHSITGTEDSQRLAFMEHLQNLVDLSTAPDQVESTIRCTEVDGQEVRETLFSCSQGVMDRLSRVRRATAADLSRRPRPTSMVGGNFKNSPWRRPVLVLAVILATLGLAWQTGVVDRMLAVEAESLQVSAGPLDNFLNMSVEKEWGQYIVTLERGTHFPKDRVAFKTLAEAAQDMEHAVALQALARGDVFFVHLVGEDGKLIFEKSISLRTLLLAPESQVEVILPGSRTAARIELALTPAPRTQ